MSNQPGTLPLKLVDFEHYMLVDDHENYPMVIPVVLQFEGRLTPELLDASFAQTIQTHPLLRARVQEVGGNLCWVEADQPIINWNAVQIPTLVRIDLETGCGLRVFARHEGETTTLRIFVHHAVTDGSGILLFLEYWLSTYEQLANEEAGPNPNKGVLSNPKNSPESIHLNQGSLEALNRRGKFGMNFWKYLLRPFQEFCGAIGVIEYFSHHPVAIGPQDLSSTTEPIDSLEPSHRFQCLTFSREETGEILKFAKRSRQKVNDLMLAAMYDACHHWLIKNQPGEADRHIRIMIPMDMRSPRGTDTFVGNMVSMIFLDRRPGRSNSLENIKWYVRLEMSVVKLLKLGLTFVHLIGFFRRRKKLHKLLRRDRSIASTILSNMGLILAGSKLYQQDKFVDVAGHRLNTIEIYPPIRPFTWFTSVVTTYGNRIQINTTWCSRALENSDIELIQSRFQANMLQFPANRLRG